MEHGGWICQLHGGDLIATNMLRYAVDEQSSELSSLDAPVLRGNILDSGFDDLCYVQSDAVRSLSVPKFVDIRSPLKLGMP